MTSALIIAWLLSLLLYALIEHRAGAWSGDHPAAPIWFCLTMMALECATPLLIFMAVYWVLP
jgi:hypothetical protein